MDSKVVPPDPARLIEGLRDTGYVFQTALADLVDNSVSAKADHVKVDVLMDYGGQISVMIADDGCGMTRDDLENAMRYGSPPRTDPFSLGKFGLGLKTASTAFCRKLSVVTRSSDGAVSKATWDLDHIAKVSAWELLFPEPTAEELAVLDGVAGDGPGTVVVWETVDRLLKDYSNPGGPHARKALDREVAGFRQHAAAVYQRFLDPDDQRARTFELVVNGDTVAAWDPFCTAEEATVLAAQNEVAVELPDGTPTSFLVRAYILPRKEEFSTAERAQQARIGNDTQGFYIYREQRLIHSMDWLRMFNREPHLSLLRVEFSFDHRLDDAFHIDIKKSQVILSEELYDYIREQFIPSPRRAADQKYRKGVRDDAGKAGKTAHASSNRSIEAHEDEVKIADVQVTDPAKGEVQITNPKGKLIIKVPVVAPPRPDECFVKPEAQIDDGLLWEPCVMEGHTGVRINMGHPYYQKVYVPNLASGVTVQGMDSLLWALCQAEWGTISDSTREHSKEIRYEVSRILRRLVEGLPDPDVQQVDGDE